MILRFWAAGHNKSGWNFTTAPWQAEALLGVAAVLARRTEQKRLTSLEARVTIFRRGGF